MYEWSGQLGRGGGQEGVGYEVKRVVLLGITMLKELVRLGWGGEKGMALGRRC